MNKNYIGTDIVLYLNSISQAIYDKRKQSAASIKNRTRSATGSGDTTSSEASYGVDTSKDVVPSAIKTYEDKQCLLEKEYKDLLYSEKFATHSQKLLELRKLILLKGLPDSSNTINSDDCKQSSLNRNIISCKSSSTDHSSYHSGDENTTTTTSIDNLADESLAHKNSLRTSIWKLLLGVSFEFKPEEYRQRVKEGPTVLDGKIRDDSFRTFKNSEEFWSKVENDDLIRVLNAIAHEHGYVQGMNVLLAPFIYTMHEIDSYYCFKALITNHCKQYISKNLDGVTAACHLFRQSLQALDPQLFTHIRRWMPELEHWRIFSMPPLMTLFASMKPLGEVLKVWDAIFAFGIHFNILLLVVHVMLIRDSLLHMNNAYKIKMRIEDSNKGIDAELLVHCALGMVQFIDQDLFRKLALHPMVLLASPNKDIDTDRDRDQYQSTLLKPLSLRRNKTAPVVSVSASMLDQHTHTTSANGSSSKTHTAPVNSV
jgi:cell cycle arrest protein BUB2